MSTQVCEMPNPSRLAAFWSRAIALPARLWPDLATPQHPCAARVARDMARELRHAPGFQRRDTALTGPSGNPRRSA